MTNERPQRPPRSPAVAGTFYPREKEALLAAIKESFLCERGPGRVPRKTDELPARKIVAGVVPHAGYVYSGPVAAHLYLELGEARPPKTVVILGVNHHGTGGLFTLSDEDWATPLGVVPTDRELLKALGRPPVEIDARSQRLEHSIEVQLPFLQYLWGNRFSMVALQVTFMDLPLLTEVGRIVRDATAGKDVLLLSSTDLSHYLPPEEAAHWDGEALRALQTLSPGELYETVVSNDISMCVIAPTTALLSALEDRKLRIRLLKQGTSGDAEPMETVVGYASLALEP